jgi:hypothetical protein
MVTIAASVLSLVLIAIFWHPWLLFGPIVDIALIGAALLSWPKG